MCGVHQIDAVIFGQPPLSHLDRANLNDVLLLRHKFTQNRSAENLYFFVTSGTDGVFETIVLFVKDVLTIDNHRSSEFTTVFVDARVASGVVFERSTI